MKTKVFAVIMAVVSVFNFAVMAQEEVHQHNSAAGEKILLRIKLDAGDKYDMKMSQVQNVTQTMNGQEMQISQDQETVMGYEVLAVEPNGVAKVKTMFKSMKIKTKTPQGEFEYDSAKPVLDSNNPMSQMMGAMYSAMVGASMTMKLKPNGEVYEVDGLGAMMEKLAEAGPEAEMIKQMMKQMFDDEKMKDSMGEMFVVYPDEPVVVGQAWYDEMGLDIGFPIDYTTTYMLVKRENGLAYIDSVAKMDLGDEAQKIEMGPMKTSFQMAGTVNQSIVVDELSGWLKSADGKMNLTGIIKMEPNAQMPNGMTMPMKIDGIIKVETLKVE